MMRQWTKVLSVGFLVLASACGLGNEDESSFRAAVPDDDSVTIKTPQQSNAEVGQTADWYEVTWGATTAVNVSVLAILDVVHAVVQFPATSHPSANVYVWGPSQPQGLEPLAYKLTVTDNGDHTYSYNLDARDKNAPDAPASYQTLLSGTHAPVVNGGVNDDRHGQGTFVLDWDARAQLPVPPQDAQGRTLQGTWQVSYDHRTADVAVDVAFTQTLDDQGHPTSSTYHYSQPSGGDGKFQFSTDTNVSGTATSLAEHVTIESRWKTDGSGRADVEITGGDLAQGQSGTASQCWDDAFVSTYEEVGLPSLLAPVESGVAAECTFDVAEYYGG